MVQTMKLVYIMLTGFSSDQIAKMFSNFIVVIRCLCRCKHPTRSCEEHRVLRTTVVRGVVVRSNLTYDKVAMSWEG